MTTLSTTDVPAPQRRRRDQAIAWLWAGSATIHFLSSSLDSRSFAYGTGSTVGAAALPALISLIASRTFLKKQKDKAWLVGGVLLALLALASFIRWAVKT